MKFWYNGTDKVKDHEYNFLQIPISNDAAGGHWDRYRKRTGCEK